MSWWCHNQRIQRLRQLRQRHYLPLLLGVIATIVILTMWRHLLKHEQLHTHQLVQQEVAPIQAELSQELSTRILTLEQMALSIARVLHQTLLPRTITLVQGGKGGLAGELAAGSNDYISKPFREETLFLKLQEYLGLEYLYADSERTSNAPSVQSPGSNPEGLAAFEPCALAQLPSSWLEALEDLALCGNDRVIVDLTTQLLPEFDALRMPLTDLANRYKFEQIVQLLHLGSSP